MRYEVGRWDMSGQMIYEWAGLDVSGRWDRGGQDYNRSGQDEI